MARSKKTTKSSAKKTSVDTVSSKSKASAGRLKTRSKKFSKKQVIVFAIVLVVLASLYFFRGLYISAMVNNQPISRLEVIRMLEERQGQQALDNLITETLVMQEARKSGITVGQEDVDQQISEIEQNLTSQGQTLESALAFQGMTREDLSRQVELQLLIEKLLSDNVEVSEEEVNTYIEENESLFSEDMSEEEIKNQAREQLKQQKVGQEFQTWITELKNNANIKYFVDY